MNFGKWFHISAQLVGMAAQFMMDPSAELFGWGPSLVKWLHSFVGFAQGAFGILALYWENPNKGGPVDSEAMSLEDLKR